MRLVSFFKPHKFQLDAFRLANVTFYSFFSLFHPFSLAFSPFEMAWKSFLFHSKAYTSNFLAHLNWNCIRKPQNYGFRFHLFSKYYNEIHWNPFKLSESVCFMYVGRKKRHKEKEWQNGWRKTIKTRTNQTNVDPNERSLM